MRSEGSRAIKASKKFGPLSPAENVDKIPFVLVWEILALMLDMLLSTTPRAR